MSVGVWVRVGSRVRLKLGLKDMQVNTKYYIIPNTLVLRTTRTERNKKKKKKQGKIDLPFIYICSLNISFSQGFVQAKWTK